MLLSIRLQRVGRRNEPTFRVVLTDSKNGPKSGKALEVLGSYDSRRAEKSEMDAEKIKYWMSKGAKLSGTMHNLLVNKKVITGKKVNVLPKKKPIKKEAEKGAEEVKKEEAPEAPAESSPEPSVDAKQTA